MNTQIKLAVVPVGKAWDPNVRDQVDEILDGLPERVEVEMFDAAYDEIVLLDRVKSVTASNPAAVVTVAMHGTSARNLTYITRKIDRPTAIWCHNEKHSLASSALAREALRQLGTALLYLHGNPDKVISRLTAFCEAAGAKQKLADTRIGKMGSLHYTAVSAEINPLVLFRRFGTWIVPLPITELRRRLPQIDPGRLEQKISEFKKRCRVEIANETFRTAVGMHLVFSDLADQHQLDIVAIDCWNEIVPEFGTSPCMGFLEEKYRIACEGDILLATALVTGEMISGQPGYVGDFYSFDEKTGGAVLMHCAGCGALHSGGELITIARQNPPGPAGTLGNVAACRPNLPTGPGTIVYLHGEQADRLHVRSCTILHTEFPDQMCVHVRVEGDGEQFIAHAPGNHYVIFPGEHVDSWKQWAALTQTVLDE